MTSSPKVARKWMPDEDQRLRAVLASIEPGLDINWHHVASHIPGRNNKECRKRWIYALMPTLRKGPWNEQEDALLLKGVRLHGLKWPLVSQSVRTRQPDQCSRRWHESLNPNINHGRWSLFEDQILREAVQTYGRRWTEIVERYFPNRTPIAAKKRYAQCFQAKARPSKMEYRRDHDHHGSAAISSNNTTISSSTPILRAAATVLPSYPKTLKKEEASEGSNLAQYLWCIPDHSQSMSSVLPKMTTTGEAMHFSSESSLSSPPPTTAASCVSQFSSGVIDMAQQQAFTAPSTPHYSPPYSRDGSLAGSSVAEYPIVTDVAQSWIAAAESQSAYSGSPFVFHETGYFDPSYGFHEQKTCDFATASNF